MFVLVINMPFTGDVRCLKYLALLRFTADACFSPEDNLLLCILIINHVSHFSCYWSCKCMFATNASLLSKYLLLISLLLQIASIKYIYWQISASTYRKVPKFWDAEIFAVNTLENQRRGSTMV